MMMIGLMLLATATYAQRGGNNATPEMRAERQTKRLSEQLSLDADQQKKVYALELARVQKMQEMREAREESIDARQRTRSANEDYQKSLGDILNADQKVKLSAMQAEMRENRGRSRGGDRTDMPSDSTQKKRTKRSRGPR